MMFTSTLRKHEPIFDDTTPESVTHLNASYGRGLELGLRGPNDYVYGDIATAFTDDYLIPRSEWLARIEEMEATRTRISDWCDAVGMPCLNQSSTNYCWANAPVYATQVVRSQQNQKLVLLSPASVAAPIKGFHNVGGWGKEALEWIVEKGIVPVADWPANAIDSRYYHDQNRHKALDYRVVDWTELQPRNLDHLVSMLLRRIPVACGFLWWLHEVTAVDAVWLDGTVAIRIRNSHGAAWGDNGYGILRGNKMLPDDAVCPRSAVAT